MLIIKSELQHCLGEGKRIVVGENSGGLTLPMMMVASLADKEDAKGIRGRSMQEQRMPFKIAGKLLPSFFTTTTAHIRPVL